MTEYATRLENGAPFNPFLWQLNEIIWASIKAPYPEQWRRWQLPASAYGSSADLFTSNWSRAALYVEGHAGNPQGLNLAAQNLGKLAAGITCSLALFNTPAGEWSAGPAVWQPHQFRAVDSVLSAAESAEPVDLNSKNDAGEFEEALVHCHEMAALAEVDREPAIHDMNIDMFNFGARTTRSWLDFIKLYDGRFTMMAGGTPRSSGEHIEELRRANNHLFVK
jgi:hypothetical protein